MRSRAASAPRTAAALPAPSPQSFLGSDLPGSAPPRFSVPHVPTNLLELRFMVSPTSGNARTQESRLPGLSLYFLGGLEGTPDSRLSASAGLLSPFALGAHVRGSEGAEKTGSAQPAPCSSSPGPLRVRTATKSFTGSPPVQGNRRHGNQRGSGSDWPAPCHAPTAAR